jgi:peptidoglycan hydrolase CwlO-like protein
MNEEKSSSHMELEELLLPKFKILATVVISAMLFSYGIVVRTNYNIQMKDIEISNLKRQVYALKESNDNYVNQADKISKSISVLEKKVNGLPVN